MSTPLLIFIRLLAVIRAIASSASSMALSYNLSYLTKLCSALQGRVICVIEGMFKVGNNTIGYLESVFL